MADQDMGDSPRLRLMNRNNRVGQSIRHTKSFGGTCL
jgi:hypothetical protein